MADNTEQTIEERLKNNTSELFEALEAWRDAKLDDEARQRLRDTIHELHRIAARLEIDMAVAERDEQAKKPIPIPGHRAKRDDKKRGGVARPQAQGGEQEEDQPDTGGEEGESGGKGGSGRARRPARSRRTPYKSSGGNGGEG